MTDALVGFAALLRRRGIGVGPDRTLLAAAALRLVDLGDRSATKRALRLALVTNRADETTFDELFDQWFEGESAFELVAADPGDTAHESLVDPVAELEARTASDAYVDDPAEQVAVSVDDGSDDGHDDDGGTEERRSSDDGPSASEGDTQARFDASASVGEPAATDDLGAALRNDDVGSVELPDDAVDMAALRAAFGEVRGRRLAELTPRYPSSPTLRPSSMLANPFDRDEQRTLDESVRTLWPQLVGAPAWRRRPSATGHLDLRRTLRSSVVLGGIPAAVGRRSPATSRPDLLVLVDTSVSMRPSVRLMLHLAHALRRRPGRVRVIGFVADCVDVTDVIRHADLPTALGGLLDDASGGPLDPARPSDYGAAFGSLWHRYGRLLRPSTTVLVLGDGRSNGRDPGLTHVTDITARCRRTVWWTPEPEGAWSFGNAEMLAYAQRVDVALTVRSLDDLERAANSGVLGVSEGRARRASPARR